MLAAAGVPCAILSGRCSKAVALRAGELGIKHVIQGAADKLPAFSRLLKRFELKNEDAGYMGDELVDLPVLSPCGFACAPGKAPRAVPPRAAARAPAAPP